MKENITRTQVRIPQSIYTKAKELSATKGVSFNQIVIDALANLELKEKASSPAKVKEALDLISYTMEHTKL